MNIVKKSLSAAVGMLMLAACQYNAPETPKSAAGSDTAPETSLAVADVAQFLYIPGTAIVKLSEKTVSRIESGHASEVCSELGVTSLERVFPDAGEYEARTRREGLHLFYSVEFDESVPVSKVLGMLESADGVELAEGCMKTRSLSFNDTYYSKQWGFSGNYSINVEYAWGFTTGDPNIIVCVVDQGVQQDHPDLVDNLCLTNYNFAKNNATIDAGDHGTHCAGIIAAVSNNETGIAGIAGGNYALGRKGVQVQNAQVFDGTSSARSFATAIKWGADNGAVISSNSWGYDYDTDGDGKLSEEEKARALAATPPAADKAAVDYFRQYAGCDSNGDQKPDSPMKGGVVVFAAGNDGLANGNPGCYAPVIAVGATTSAGALANYSNYGDWVDICAPGSSIYSTISGGKYSSLSGTSMACPVVSGACALLVSAFGGTGFTNDDLEEILIKGANPDKISYLAHNAGPYLDLKASFDYGIAKYRREKNEAPVISTDYTGDYVFRQYQSVDIPFVISDPDGDAVSVDATLEGRGSFVKDSDADTVWHFILIGELVSDFTPKKATIKALDMFGGEKTFEFTYQVLKNNAPEVSGSIDDFIVTGSMAAFDKSLEGVFTDPDGETPTITAKVTPATSATVSVDGDKITVKPAAFGITTVTLTAMDALRAKAQTTFRYLVREKDSEFDYYPNPVVDVLNIRTGITPADVEVSIISASGAKVFAGTLNSSAFEPGQVDMRNFAPGKYTLKVVTGGKTYENTIIKK